MNYIESCLAEGGWVSDSNTWCADILGKKNRVSKLQRERLWYVAVENASLKVSLPRIELWLHNKTIICETSNK